MVLSPLRLQYRLTAEISGDIRPRLRLAVGVSRKLFKRAHDRNRIKRQLRELLRIRKENLIQAIPPGYTLDLLVLYLRKDLPEFQSLNDRVQQALQKFIVSVNPAADSLAECADSST